MKKEIKHIIVDIETHKKVKVLAAKWETTLGKTIERILEERKND